MEIYYVEVIFKGLKGRYKTNSCDLEELLDIYSSFFNVSKSELEIRLIPEDEYMEKED